MKPPDWDKLPAEDKIDIGTRLFNSYRGKYIIAEALHTAIKALKKGPSRARDESDIQDMEILLESYYSVFHALFQAGRESNKVLQVNRRKKKPALT